MKDLYNVVESILDNDYAETVSNTAEINIVAKQFYTAMLNNLLQLWAGGKNGTIRLKETFNNSKVFTDEVDVKPLSNADIYKYGISDANTTYNVYLNNEPIILFQIMSNGPHMEVYIFFKEDFRKTTEYDRFTSILKNCKFNPIQKCSFYGTKEMTWKHIR